MDLLERVTCQVEVLLGPNDVDLFAVVESLADERHVHETEESDVAAGDLLGATHGVGGLPVEGALTEDRSEHATVLDERFDVSQELVLSLSGRADDNNV